MDFRLREIAGKAAGTYFIVTATEGSPEIEQTSNLRLIPINSEIGPVNTVVIFQKGNKSGVQQIFGKSLRKNEKQGNYGIKSVLRMLDDGPVAVLNLRAFDSALDTVNISGMSADNSIQQIATVPYQSVFNINGFWTPRGKNIPKLLTEEHLLNFANIGTGNLSYFVTVASDVTSLTAEGNLSLARTELEIEAYPALDGDMLVKDTFVDVWIFNNTFGVNSTTNQHYGQLFNNGGMVKQSDLLALSQIPESGFNRKVTGSVIPFLKNEFSEDVSIDTLLNTVTAETGLLAFINDDLLENDDKNIIDVNGQGYYDLSGDVENGLLLSYRLQANMQSISITNDNTVLFSDAGNLSAFPVVEFTDGIFTNLETNGNKVNGIFEHGIRGGAQIFFENEDSGNIEYAQVVNLELKPEIVCQYPEFGFNNTYENSANKLAVTLNLLSDDFGFPVNAALMRKLSTGTTFVKIADLESGVEFVDDSITAGATYHYVILITSEKYTDTYGTPISFVQSTGVITDVPGIKPVVQPKTFKYTPVVYTLNKPVLGDIYFRQLRPVENTNELVLPTNMSGYTPRNSQFTNGSASRQNEILDVMNTDSILKGLKNMDGIRYLVDGFKSFVEAGYKRQFGLLASELDKCNKFVRCIINEPFIEDLENSTNPLFKDTPSGVLNLGRFLAQGGNPDYTTNFLTKFTVGAELSFYYGAGEVIGSNLMVNAPAISGNFVNKTYPWDIVANASGYINGLSSIEINPDDTERLAMEKFRWNPIIKKRDGFTMFGNNTGQAKRGPLQQIHNSELLAYIKESLLNISRDESFKKGTYDEYIRLETTVTSFMDGLVQQQAIQPNPVVKCDLVNNTPEIQEARIKLVHIEYFNINGLEKVVFDLNLN